MRSQWLLQHDHLAGLHPSACLKPVEIDSRGDGTTDLVVANELADTLSVLTNNKDGTFAEPQDVTVGTEPSSWARLAVYGSRALLAPGAGAAG